MRRTLATLAIATVALAGCTQPSASPTVTTTPGTSAPSTPGSSTTTTGTPTSGSPTAPRPSSNLPDEIMNPEIIIAELNRRGISCTSKWRATDEGQGQQCATPKVWVYIDATKGELIEWMRETFETEFKGNGGVTGRGNWVVGADAATWPRVQGL